MCLGLHLEEGSQIEAEGVTLSDLEMDGVRALRDEPVHFVVVKFVATIVSVIFAKAFPKTPARMLARVLPTHPP